MRKTVVLLVLLLFVCLCSCSAGEEPMQGEPVQKEESLREDLVYASESGKYVDAAGNEISFSEDIYSVNLNYVIGWDIETLSPVKIYQGDKINGFRVSKIESQYLFYNPLEIDIYGVVSEFADENAPLFFHVQSYEFNLPEKAMHG